MRRVTWTESAVHDLRRIADHLMQADPSLVRTTIPRIILAARWLLETPHAGPIAGYRRWRKWRVPKTNYLLLYEPTLEGINLARVVHERQDWQSLV